MELQIRLKKKRANIVFRGKETTKKVLLKYLEVSK